MNANGKGGASMGHWNRTNVFYTQGHLYVSVGSEVNVDPSSYRSRTRRSVLPNPLPHASAVRLLEKESVHVYVKHPDHVAVVKEFVPNIADTIDDSDQWEKALPHTDTPAQPLPRRHLHKLNSQTPTPHNPLPPDSYLHNNATKLNAVFLLVGHTPVATIDVHTQIKLLDRSNHNLVHLLTDGKLPVQGSLIATKTFQEAHLSPLLDNSCCTAFQLVFVDGLRRIVPATPS